MPDYKGCITLYEHDSNCCTYLGMYNIEEGPYAGGYDLYVCKTTVIARYSSYGPDYYSGLCFAKNHPPIKKAAERAIAMGLLTQEQVDQAVGN